MTKSNKPMTGKICLITGGTSGIGEATACELARLGSTVVITARNEEKSKRAIERIRAESGSREVEALIADLASQAQVRNLANEFVRMFNRLDVLINNAGAVFLRRQLSADGIEMTFAVNQLAPFLLTNLLLEAIKASAPSRIINVASGSHKNAVIEFNDLGGENGYRFMRAYGQSKLANVMFTYELARKLEGSRVSVNAVHPGFVATNIGGNNGRLVRLFLPLMRIFAINPEEGAKTVVYLASSPDVANVSGEYFCQMIPIPSSRISHDVGQAQRLWDISARMTDLDR